MHPASACCVAEEPTPEDFVGAVIRTHERIRSSLRALHHGAAVLPAFEPSAEERTINDYCLHHGVETPPRPQGGPSEHRWLAV